MWQLIVAMEERLWLVCMGSLFDCMGFSFNIVTRVVELQDISLNRQASSHSWSEAYGECEASSCKTITKGEVFSSKIIYYKI